MPEFVGNVTKVKGVYVRPGSEIPEDLPAFILAYYGKDSAPIYLSGPVFEDDKPDVPWWHISGSEIIDPMAYVGRKFDGGWEVV